MDMIHKMDVVKLLVSANFDGYKSGSRWKSIEAKLFSKQI